MEPTRAVNLRKEAYDVYVGRAGHGQGGYFGNPFTVERYGLKRALDLFRSYFHNRLATDVVFYDAVQQLKGKRLGCFCRPFPCHAEVIAAYLDGRQEEGNDPEQVPDVKKVQEEERPQIMGLSIHQPWCYWIAAGKKRIENRSWMPPDWMFGRFIALHATKTYDAEAARWIRGTFPHLGEPRDVHSGAIIGVAKLVGLVKGKREAPTKQIIRGVEHLRHGDLDWFFGEYGWLLADATMISPVPCRGYQRLWRLPPELHGAVRSAYNAARGTTQETFASR